MKHRSGFQLGPWLLTHKIAAGGMGEVFVALKAGQGADQAPVAVKALRAHLSADDDAVERFVAEARIASRFDHPNLVRIHGVGMNDGRRWLAMDLFPAVSVAALLEAAQKGGQPLPADVLVWVGRALCDGLGYAHGLDVVHRDVTPHNVLAGIDGGVKLTDFGVAQVRAGDQSSRPGSMMGKLQYLSPEQLEGLPATEQSDIYSAGVTLFVLATFVEPFARASPHLVARAIRGEEPPDLATLRPDLPPGFVSGVKAAMSRKPHDRFATALALRDVLGPMPAGAPQTLAQLVRSLCPEETGALTAAITEARGLAAQTADLPAPPPSTPSFPPIQPRGTLEVQTVRRKPTGPGWGLWAACAAALALLGILAARWM